MHSTKNDLGKKNREKTIEILNARLADAIDLKTQAKQAHWNVKGPHFIGLHELFDQVATAVEAHIDLIAERATALGGTAMGTARVVAQTSTLSEYPLEIFDGTAHVDALSTAMSDFGKKVRTGLTKPTNSAMRTRLIYLLKFRAKLINFYGLSKRIFKRRTQYLYQCGLTYSLFFDELRYLRFCRCRFAAPVF